MKFWRYPAIRGCARSRAKTRNVIGDLVCKRAGHDVFVWSGHCCEGRVGDGVALTAAVWMCQYLMAEGRGLECGCTFQSSRGLMNWGRGFACHTLH